VSYKTRKSENADFLLLTRKSQMYAGHTFSFVLSVGKTHVTSMAAFTGIKRIKSLSMRHIPLQTLSG